jgi:hypothetical protein
MTFGAITLRLLETKPSPLSPIDLMAAIPPLGFELDTDAPLNSGLWKHVVVHTSAEGGDIAKRSHFIVEADGTVLIHATGLWKAQRTSQHVPCNRYDYNSDTIAVCVRGDFAARPPSARQFQELVKLVRMIQQACNIPAGKVFMYRDLAPGQSSPGNAFPVRTFSSALMRE